MPTTNRVLATCCLLFSLSSTESFAADWVYFARDGDTFWDLCLKYTNKRGCWLELGKYNQIRNDRRIPIGTRILFPVTWLKQLQRVGEARSVSGNAQYDQFDNGRSVALIAGQELHLGARINTGEGSATIILESGDEVFLRPQSSLLLQRFSTSSTGKDVAEMELDKGTAEAKVSPAPGPVRQATGSDRSKRRGGSRFQIFTPAAIAAVRGTEFRVSSSADGGTTMRGEVVTGLLEVAAAGSTAEVPAGFGVSATKGSAPSNPRKLLDAPVFLNTIERRHKPVSLTWQSVPLAVAWILDVYQSSGDGQPLLSKRIESASVDLSELGESCYEVAVRAIDADGFNGLESRRPLCVLPTLGVPVLADLVTGTDVTLVARWDEVKMADSYVVEISEQRDFGQLLKTSETTALELEITDVNAKEFFVRVKSIASDGTQSRYSDISVYTREDPLPFYLWIATSILLVLVAI